MVNEVVPRDRLLERAWELADEIMKQSRTTRRLTTQVVRRPWKQRLLDNLDGGFGIQMFSHLANKEATHKDKLAAAVLDRVPGNRKEGLEF